jgi:hypothetical protein
MYDTPYNRIIANQVLAINEKYARRHPVHSGKGRAGALENVNYSLGFMPKGGARSGGAMFRDNMSDAVEDMDLSGGVRSGGVRSGGVRSGGVRSGGVRSGGVRSGGVRSGGVRSGGVRSGGAVSKAKERGMKIKHLMQSEGLTLGQASKKLSGKGDMSDLSQMISGGKMSAGAKKYKKVKSGGKMPVKKSKSVRVRVAKKSLSNKSSSGKMSREERGQHIKRIMKEKGVSLGEASKMLKHEMA